MARPSVKSRQVRDLLVQQFIASRQPVDVLPSERSLAELFGVSRVTVRTALKMLEDEGLLRSAPGVGTFVAAPHVSTKAPALKSFSEEIRERGWTPGSRLVETKVEAADFVVAHDLSIEPGTPYYEITRIRLADEVPLSIERVRLPEAYFPGLLEHDLTGSLYELLSTAYGVRVFRHERRISAMNVDAPTAELFGVAERAAGLYVVQTAFDQNGRKVEHGRSLYRGDRYDFNTVAYAHQEQ
ncbi:GntR family transcriptional regulator [Phytoactinopolyspora halotolerans]|uniref:GntR family transcriptional regulator n=1 Tax=Phytoactinopolyspora halotolerans TaxID=1981512 RepID=A0A6L9SFC4_9ACTN|nr:GntR family transcriptional regulator [Phytoactinopolyspora halotolerans]NEE03201.1 GntR family transcriptional regulator [Phytoactinopolyspora halotolerans]